MLTHNATVIVQDRDLNARCPEFESNYKKNFIVVKDFKNLNIRVLRLKDCVSGAISEFRTPKLT